MIVNPSPIRGGAEELLEWFCARTAAVDPVVACLADGPFPDDLERAGIAVRRLRAGRLRHPWSWARTVRALAALARESDAVLSWQVKGHYYGTPAARRARRPAAWWDHGIRPARGEPRFVIDNVLPSAVRADLVVCSSEAAAARHRAARTIHPAIPLERYGTTSRADARARLGIPADAFVVGSVGRLQPWKGQHVLVRAAGRFLREVPGSRLVVVGGTPGGFDAGYPASLERLARDLGIADHVTFAGQRDDVPDLLPAFDAFVLPSLGEPFGIVTVEAMASGVPVIVTSAGGVREIVEHEGTGLLVPPDDAGAIGDAVVRLHGDRALADRLAAAGRARAAEAFGIDRFVRDVDAFVSELAGRR